MDGNCWAGPDLINGNPDKQNSNGALLQDFLERNNNLRVVNNLEICEGSITRSQNTTKVF